MGDRTVREPEWDWIDRAIITAWSRLNRQLCTLCGRPWAIHKDDSLDDYFTGHMVCTATAALDAKQAEVAKGDESERKEGRSPERARQWFVWTQAEGMPTFD